MKKQVNKLIKDYQLSTGSFVKEAHESKNFSVGIELGNDEGYYVVITNDMETISIRQHDKGEALQTLKTMLLLLPNN